MLVGINLKIRGKSLQTVSWEDILKHITEIKIASKYQRFQRVSSVEEKNPLIGLTSKYENLPWSQVLYSPSNQ